MDAAYLRRNSTPKTLEVLPLKKIKRIQHIKSLPAFDQDLMSKNSLQKIETHISKDQNEIKLKRFKTQQSLKPPNFGAVKTARERTVQWARKRQRPCHQSKSLTKSTTYRSPHEENQRKKRSRNSKQKSKKSMKKAYSNIMNRVKNVIQEYQLKLDRCKQQKQEIIKQNMRLKNQIQSMNKKSKKTQR